VILFENPDVAAWRWMYASVSILRRVSRSLAQFLSCCI